MYQYNCRLYILQRISQSVSIHSRLVVIDGKSGKNGLEIEFSGADNVNEAICLICWVRTLSIRFYNKAPNIFPFFGEFRFQNILSFVCRQNR